MQASSLRLYEACINEINPPKGFWFSNTPDPTEEVDHCHCGGCYECTGEDLDDYNYYEDEDQYDRRCADDVSWQTEECYEERWPNLDHRQVPVLKHAALLTQKQDLWNEWESLMGDLRYHVEVYHAVKALDAALLARDIADYNEAILEARYEQ
jgi:hypothetical protein